MAGKQRFPQSSYIDAVRLEFRDDPEIIPDDIVLARYRVSAQKWIVHDLNVLELSRRPEKLRELIAISKRTIAAVTTVPHEAAQRTALAKQIIQLWSQIVRLDDFQRKYLTNRLANGPLVYVTRTGKAPRVIE